MKAITDKDQLVGIFLLIPLAMIITAVAYYLFEHIFYIPHVMPVFLAPRFYGGTNDLSSAIFSQWKELALVLPALVLIVLFAYWLGIKKGLAFRKYLWVMYGLALVVVILFLFLTPHGLHHVELQTKTINNGGWYSLNALHARPAFNNAGPLCKIQYIFQVLCSNEAGYTIPGTTHPAGVFLVSFSILAAVKFVSVDLLGGDINTMAVTWGILVTLLNALLIPIVMTIAKKAYSEPIGKWTGIFMLTLPSVCFHFCAMVDGIASLVLAMGMLLLVYVLKYDCQENSYKNQNVYLYYGLGAGAFFTLAAQMTFGHAMPILALLAAFYFLERKSDLTRIKAFSLGLIVPVALYFIFESWISAGKSSWLVRAFAITSSVEHGLDVSRPYPLAHVANFVVMSVMGGILFLPVLGYICVVAAQTVAGWLMKTKPEAPAESSVRQFLLIASLIMLIMLLFQKTARLEVERIWHWFFIPIWSLMGIFFPASQVVLERLFPLIEPGNKIWRAPLVLCVVQLLVTVCWP